MTGLPARAVLLQDFGPLVRASFGLSEEHEEYRRGAGEAIPAPLDILALLDTGASMTFLTAGAFARLGVQPTGDVPVQDAGGRHQARPSYIGTLHFLGSGGEEVRVPHSRAVELPDLGRIGAVIGRDVLSHGRLLYDGREGACTLVLRGVDVPLADPPEELTRGG